MRFVTGKRGPALGAAMLLLLLAGCGTPSVVAGGAPSTSTEQATTHALSIVPGAGVTANQVSPPAGGEHQSVTEPGAIQWTTETCPSVQDIAAISGLPLTVYENEGNPDVTNSCGYSSDAKESIFVHMDFKPDYTMPSTDSTGYGSPGWKSTMLDGARTGGFENAWLQGTDDPIVNAFFPWGSGFMTIATGVKHSFDPTTLDQAEQATDLLIAAFPS